MRARLSLSLSCGVWTGALEDFLRTLPAEAKRAGPFQPLLQMLLRMGLRTDAAQALCDDDSLEGPYRRRLGKLLDIRIAQEEEARERRKARPSALVYMQ